MSKTKASEMDVADRERPSRTRHFKSLLSDILDAIVTGRDAQLDYRRQIAHGIHHEQAVKSILMH